MTDVRQSVKRFDAVSTDTYALQFVFADGRGLLPAAPGLGWLGEGLLILGWVALWRPVEVLLYEHWEAADERRALERLAAARVEFVVVADTGSA